MNKFTLEQLLNQKEKDSNQRSRQVYDSYNFSISKSTNKKLNRVERLIFLRMFKFMKKSYRRDNQIEIAFKLKVLFEEAYKLKVFDYFWDSKLIRDFETNDSKFIDLPKEVVMKNLKLTEDFLVKIGLSNVILNKYLGYGDNVQSNNCFRLDGLKIYMLDASPAAIVQMNKRLKTLKNKNRL